MEIKDIFPTPVGFALNEGYLQTEHDHLINLEYEFHKDYNMTVSKNKFVLSSEPLFQITQFIKEQIKEYATKTLGTHQSLRFTQSWCSKHEDSIQTTFPHIHQNSIISGSYYIHADSNSEGITFYKNTDYTDRYITWQTDPELMKTHYWNWRWCKFPVKTGLLILFPSHLKHAVDGLATAHNLRCSLAFNTWFEGNIGNPDDMSML